MFEWIGLFGLFELCLFDSFGLFWLCMFRCVGLRFLASCFVYAWARVSALRFPGSTADLGTGVSESVRRAPGG